MARSWLISNASAPSICSPTALLTRSARGCSSIPASPIARDRSTEYARGATAGVPNAQQIADRWHLLKNLREVVERLLNRRHAARRQLPLLVPSALQSGTIAPGPAARGALRTPSASERVTSAVARERRLAPYTAVRTLSDQGLNILQIAKRLGISRTTVRRYRQAAVFPERGGWRDAPSILDPYREHLYHRWAAGCQNASHLWRAIQAMGIPGTRKHVERWAQRYRQEPAPSTPNIYRQGIREQHAAPAQALATPRQLAWLLVRNPETLSPADAATVVTITQDQEVALNSSHSKFSSWCGSECPPPLIRGFGPVQPATWASCKRSPPVCNRTAAQ